MRFLIQNRKKNSNVRKVSDNNTKNTHVNLETTLTCKCWLEWILGDQSNYPITPDEEFSWWSLDSEREGEGPREGRGKRKFLVMRAQECDLRELGHTATSPVVMVRNCNHVHHQHNSNFRYRSKYSKTIFCNLQRKPIRSIDIYSPVADPGGGRGGHGPPGPVKIGHKKDGRRRWPHRFHVSRTPPYPAAGSATAVCHFRCSMFLWMDTIHSMWRIQYFPDRGEGTNFQPIIWWSFPKNCVDTRKIGPRRWVRPRPASLRILNFFCLIFDRTIIKSS